MQGEFPNSKLNDRIIALVDMDCFYVQVEQRLCPEYFGKPCVVVQYNAWKGGGIIAVNYEARAFGVQRRGMRGNEAKKQCPDLHLFRVPEERGKANLTRYRKAGAEVMEVLCKFSNCVERASIDEAYLDLTEEVNNRLATNDTMIVSDEALPNTFVVGWEKNQSHEDEASGPSLDDRKAGLSDWLKSSCSVNAHNRKLAVAAIIVEEMRAAVYKETGFRCSAGIAHNKMLAKLSCGLHKPNRQTILPQQSVPILYETLPVNKVRSLGGKLGEAVKEKLSVNTMAELSKLKESQLQKCFGEKNGSYLFQLGQGIETDEVIARQLAKSIGCGKNFRGKEALTTKSKVSHWVSELSEELSERLKQDQEMNNRVAKLLCVSVQRLGDTKSRSCALHSYDSRRIAADVLTLLQKFNTADTNSDTWQPTLHNISLSATKFQDNLEIPSVNINSFFRKSGAGTSVGVSEIQDEKKDDFTTVVDTVVEDVESVLKPAMASSPKGFFAKKMKGSSCISNSSTSSSTRTPKSASNHAKNITSNHSSLEVLAASELPSVANFFFKPLQTTDFSQQGSLGEANGENLTNTTNESAVSTEEDGFSYKCHDCNRIIPLQDIEEHSDYHFAEKLSKEIHPVSARAALSDMKRKTVKQQKRKISKDNRSGKKTKTEIRTLDFYMK